MAWLATHEGWKRIPSEKLATAPRLLPTPAEPRNPAFAAALATLSRQEHIVLRARCQGFTDREIGEHYFICVRTAKNHLNRIFHKLRLSGKGSSARACFLLGLEDGWQASCRRDVRR